MNDFLLNNYSFLYRLFIGISVLTGLLYYKKYKHTNVKYFIWFLIYIFCFEMIAGYTDLVAQQASLYDVKMFLKGTRFETNYWVYNLFWRILATLFISFYYLKVLKSKVNSLVVKYAASIFVLFSVIYVMFNIDDFFNGIIIPVKIAAVSVIFLCVMFYFIEILNGDKILTFYRSFNFYVSAALLIWWLVTTPVMFYQIYFSTADWNFIFLRWQIFLFANLFMYSIFTFALIFSIPEDE